MSTTNFEIYDLKKLIGASTGSYNDENELIIHTDNWDKESEYYIPATSIVGKNDSIDNKSEFETPTSTHSDALKKARSIMSVNSWNELDTPNTEQNAAEHNSSEGNYIKTTADSDEDPFVANQKYAHKPLKSTTSSNKKRVVSKKKVVTFKAVESGGKRGLFSVIGILCSNNVILLRLMGTFKKIQQSDRKIDKFFQHDEDEKQVEDSVEAKYHELATPIVRCITHFKDNAIAIANIALEKESARWMTVTSKDGSIYIIPICKHMFPYETENIWPFMEEYNLTVNNVQHYPSLYDFTTKVNDQTINYLNRVKRISKLDRLNKKYDERVHGSITTTKWWKTLTNQYYMLMGTEKGYLLCVSMQTCQEIFLIQVLPNHSVQQLVVVTDQVSRNWQFVILHCSNSQYYKIQLEYMANDKMITIIDFLKAQNTKQSPSKNEKKRVEQMAASFGIETINSFNQDTCSKLSIWDSPKQGQFILLFSKETKQLQIFDPNDFRFSHFIFQLNEHTSKVYCTSNMIFAIQQSDEQSEFAQIDRVWCISRALVEAPLSLASFRSPAVFQEFHLPKNQCVLSMLEGFHYNAYEGIDNLEGCFIVTQNSIFEMQQKASPNAIFQRLLYQMNPSEQSTMNVRSEEFGKTFKLDVLQLYEDIGDCAFDDGNIELALLLYRYSNVSQVKYVQKLSAIKTPNEVIEYIEHTIKDNQLSDEDVRHLNELLMYSYLNTLSEEFQSEMEFKEGDRKANFEKMRTFFMTSPYFPVHVALNELVERGFFVLSLEVGHAQAQPIDCISFILSKIIENGVIHLNDRALAFLQQHNYDTILIEKGYSILLVDASPVRQIAFILSYMMKARVLQKQKLLNKAQTKAESDDILACCLLRSSQVDQDAFPIAFSNLLKRGFKNLRRMRHPEKESMLVRVARAFHPSFTIFDDKTELREAPISQIIYYPGVPIQDHVGYFIDALFALRYDRPHDVLDLDLEFQTYCTELRFKEEEIYIVRYAQKLLETYLVQCAHLYDRSSMIRQCIRYKNKKALCVVYEHFRMREHHLSIALSLIHDDYKDHVKSNVMMDTAIQLFTKLILRSPLKQHDVHTTARLVLTFFRFWHAHQLDLARLESLCMDYLGSLGTTLSYILQESGNHADLRRFVVNQSPFGVPFSNKLLLKISRSCVQAKRVSMMQDVREIHSIQQRILSHMDKHLQQRQHVKVPMRFLLAQPMYFFSCGDKYRQDDFLNHCLPVLESALDSLSDAMTSSDEANQLLSLARDVLLTEYRRPSGHLIAQACPSCMYRALVRHCQQLALTHPQSPFVKHHDFSSSSVLHLEKYKV